MRRRRGAVEPTEEEVERLADATVLAARAPEPARVGRVLCGTAGWTEPTLLQSHLFYPPGATSAEARLRHYAHHFPMVEVDATYYALLPRETSERWVRWTPESFRFDVKANPVLTGHPIDVTRLPSDLRAELAPDGAPRRVRADELPATVAREIEARFLDFLRPLQDGGRLGALFLQLPPWVGATRGAVRRLEGVFGRLQGVPCAVEFRNRTWLEPSRADRVFALLEAAGASYVVVDEPDVPLGGVPPTPRVTNPELAVVRFHGHNARGWRRGASVAERFDYTYTEAELAAWVPPVRKLAREAKQVHAVFNNCVRNQAVLGAKGLSVLLAESPERT